MSLPLRPPATPPAAPREWTGEDAPRWSAGALAALVLAFAATVALVSATAGPGTEAVPERLVTFVR